MAPWNLPPLDHSLRSYPYPAPHDPNTPPPPCACFFPNIGSSSTSYQGNPYQPPTWRTPTGPILTPFHSRTPLPSNSSPESPRICLCSSSPPFASLLAPRALSTPSLVVKAPSVSAAQSKAGSQRMPVSANPSAESVSSSSAVVSPPSNDLGSALARLHSHLNSLCTATAHFLPPAKNPLPPPRDSVQGGATVQSFSSTTRSRSKSRLGPVPTGTRNLSTKSLERRTRRLREELRKLAHRHGSFLRLGVSAIHVPTGQHAGVRQHSVFPLASISKLPLLLTSLHRISCSCACHNHHEPSSRGVLLSTRLRMDEKDKCIGSGILKRLSAPLNMSLQHCLQLMHSVSDNTAADLVARAVPLKAVRRFLHAHGMHCTSVHLSQRQAFLIALGQSPSPRLAGLDGQDLARAWASLPLEEQMRIAQRTEAACQHLSVDNLRSLEYASEARQKSRGSRGLKEDMAVAAAVDNWGSPSDTSRLLLRLARGQLLRPFWTGLAHSMMAWQEFGVRRIPFFLPKESVGTWHKTGSIMGVINGAGIVQGEDSGCHFAIAAFADCVHRRHEREAEYVIARAAKLTYNMWCGR